MKRIIIILVIIANCFLLFVQCSNPNSHMDRMINWINDGQYEDAAKELTMIEDWNNYNTTLIIDSAFVFYEIINCSQNVSPTQKDSLTRYILRTCEYCINNETDDVFNALNIYEKYAVLMAKHKHGNNDSSFIATTNETARICLDYSEWDNADRLLRKALEYNISKDTITQEQYAYTLSNYGWLYLGKDDIRSAEQYAIQSIDFIEKNKLTNKQFAYAVNLLGVTYQVSCNFPKAEQYIDTACQLRAKVYGEASTEHIAALTNLGSLYDDMGNYFQAEQILLQCYNWAESKKNAYMRASIALNLGLCYAHINDYSKAEALTMQSLLIARDTLQDHCMTAWALTNLGQYAHHNNDLTSSEQYLKQALELFDKGSADYARALENLGTIYIDSKKFTQAEQCAKEAIRIFRKLYGDKHLDYFIASTSLGDLYIEKKDYKNASKQYLSILEGQNDIFGEMYLENEPLLYKLSIANGQLGKFVQSYKYIKLSEQVNRFNYIESLRYLTENQRLSFSVDLKHKYENIYTIFCLRNYKKDKTITSFAYNNELFYKGLHLFSNQQISNTITESNDKTLIKEWEEFTEKKQQIQALQEKDPQSEYLKQLMQESEQLEKQIIIKSAVYRENRDMWKITWDSVRNHLKKNQVAIEYMVAPLNDDSTMYCALLLRKNSKYPELFPLFNEKDVLPLINIKTANQETPYKANDYNGNGKILTEKVWGKILPYIKKGETIYFAPSGLLYQLAIEALPYDSTHSMTDMFNLVRLSSTREIVLHKDNKRHEKAALYGGIQYNMSGKEFLTESQRYAGTDLLASRGIVDNTNNRGTVAYLKGTKEEVENINQMLKENQLQVQLFTSTTANEESFKALSGKHQNILHIATHGFYWTDSTAQKSDYFSQRMMTFDQNMPTPPSIDPLNRCGLLFAGANTAYSGHSSELPEGVQDGILTAKEISLLDLRDADLVVLSACETGKGEITGEGVFGLQRAFKQAGAQTLVMSLWKVNDKATQLLMTEFYRNLISKHQSKREAFRNAQNHVRSQYKEPYYWAGFIMLD